MKKMKLLLVSFILSVPLFWNAAQAEDKSKMTLTNELIQLSDVVSQEAAKLKFVLDSNNIPNGGLYFDAQTGEVFVFLIKSADQSSIHYRRIGIC